ncbi:MAG TPA: PRC-barrel domain-containing protein [Phycisphaerales bacterium]|nr:PRC-barrel domain-containing protein [Phycisphaerales bacterium]
MNFSRNALPLVVIAALAPVTAATANDDMKTWHLMQSEKLIGANIYGTNHEKVGDVRDLLISRPSGRVAYALVGSGGVLGIGEKVIAVPYSALSFTASDKSFMIPMSKDQFKAAPNLEHKEWRTLSESGPSDATYRYFNAQRWNDNDPEGARPYPSKLSMSDWPLLRQSDIQGKKLIDDANKEIAKVDDLAIDPYSGRVAFLVVTFGSTLGFGGERAAVPWNMFDVTSDGRIYGAKLDKASIEAAPRITNKDWSELRDVGFTKRVYSHYGVDAPWINRAPEMTTDKTGMPGSGTNSMNNWKSGTSDEISAYNRLYAGGRERKIVGTVTRTDYVSPASGVPEVTVWTIRTTDGTTYQVHAAPKAYMDQQKWMLKEGDRVTINGRWVEVDGKSYLMATDFARGNDEPNMLRRSNGDPVWTNNWK